MRLKTTLTNLVNKHELPGGGGNEDSLPFCQNLSKLPIKQSTNPTNVQVHANCVLEAHFLSGADVSWHL
jgi:hypothetical protein